MSRGLDKKTVMVLGDKLKQARLAKGLTQREAAEIAGVDSSYISRYESGQRDPSALALRGLATIYGVTVDWLTGQADEPTAPPVAPRNVPARRRIKPEPDNHEITPEDALENLELILDEPNLFLRVKRGNLTVEDMADIADAIETGHPFNTWNRTEGPAWKQSRKVRSCGGD